MSTVRHLTRQFAEGALRRGAGIEQLAGYALLDEGVVVEYWRLRTSRDGPVNLTRHRVLDLEWPRVGDLGEYPDAADGVYGGEDLVTYEDPTSALDGAEREHGLAPERWVNAGVVPGEHRAARSEGRPGTVQSELPGWGAPVTLPDDLFRPRGEGTFYDWTAVALQGREVYVTEVRVPLEDVDVPYHPQLEGTRLLDGYLRVSFDGFPVSRPEELCGYAFDLTPGAVGGGVEAWMSVDFTSVPVDLCALALRRLEGEHAELTVSGVARFQEKGMPFEDKEVTLTCRVHLVPKSLPTTLVQPWEYLRG